MKKVKLCIFFSLCALLLSSCSNYNKLLKSNDYDAKYNAAMELYNKENYYKAVQLFENLATYYRGKDKAETVSFYYGKSLLGMKDYFTAGYQFATFTKQFPYSKNAEEALYLSAFCKYKESPNYKLDQTLTKEAIASFQLYLDRYPQSEKTNEVIKYVEELRHKILLKDYSTAYLYYKTEQYKAATVALVSFVREYPHSEYTEPALYYMIKSSYELARHSVSSKKKERYQAVVQNFDKFSAKFSDSKYLKEVQGFYTQSLDELAKLK